MNKDEMREYHRRHQAKYNASEKGRKTAARYRAKMAAKAAKSLTVRSTCKGCGKLFDRNNIQAKIGLIRPDYLICGECAEELIWHPDIRKQKHTLLDESVIDDCLNAET